MKRLILTLPLLLAFGGCANVASFQATLTKDTTGIENWVAAVVAKVRARLPVIEADVQTAIGLMCQAVPIAQSNVPNGTKAQQYIGAAASSCASYASAQANPPTGSASANLLSSIWSAYTAGKAAMAPKASP